LATFNKKGVEIAAITLPDNPDFTMPKWFLHLQWAYVEEHEVKAKAAGQGCYLKGYNYKKVCDEFAESVRA